LSPKVLGLSAKQVRKEEQKLQILLGDQKSESNFSRIQSGINNRNFGPGISRAILSDQNFGFSKKTYEIPPEVSVEWKPKEFSKFQVKMKNELLFHPISFYTYSVLFVV
jgi:hypothetical protein